MSIYYYFDEKYEFSRLMRRYKKLVQKFTNEAASLDSRWGKVMRSDLIVDILFEKKNARVQYDKGIRELRESQEAQEILNLKTQLDEIIRNRQKELLPYLEKALKSASNTTLTNDVKMYKQELSDLHKVIRPGGYSYLNTSRIDMRGLEEFNALFETIDGENGRFLHDVIAEIEHELERRQNTDSIVEDLKRHNEALRSHMNELYLEKVELEKVVKELQDELENRRPSSEYEKLAEELLQKAQSISGAEARIREQWQVEREGQPDDRRRDIDRIYHSLLEQFREKL